MRPGEIIVKKEEDIVLNANKEITRIKVKNVSEKNIQVGSHYHFFEVNEALVFDRKKAIGKRLNIPAGTTVLFKAQSETEVELIDYGGLKRIDGFRRKNFVEGK
ncbi:urease, beta subunit [Caldicellulosiruptor saccharolyticus DSM 8903]|uniref:Urease, beta subunit n=1 Tax=Caldicellulosiruptor saccharolyticus (strain ATCC 43494 / DSM 8903 / Tp8T 6331) TaxID=351627 RepID=A4XMB0_CALS8|nr:urease subunit beta [Caldicellulosiruptor saccharolyticus]ABP68045.1 urease, beta subunit [Caldicellulosiruptor saccharolyticus DSM 8903]